MKDLNKMDILNKKVESNLKKELLLSLKDKEFEDYIRSIHMPIELLMKYTSNGSKVTENENSIVIGVSSEFLTSICNFPFKVQNS